MNKEFVFNILEERCNSVVKYYMLYPSEIVLIANDYLNAGGCKSRRDYEFLVKETIPNTVYREFLLNN